ncbi:hypothetical protein [Planctopirus ephydatiae]|uniref:hypothetical protein n=1 Tax=Planctopirus ephydatiae TaxID=2528019 RepID=UPI0011AAB1B3|nr:hypothetical protein [Planctopirus ephydatiae]
MFCLLGLSQAYQSLPSAKPLFASSIVFAISFFAIRDKLIATFDNLLNYLPLSQLSATFFNRTLLPVVQLLAFPACLRCSRHRDSR